MDQVRLAAQAFLALVHLRREVVSSADQRAICGGKVGLNFLNQIGNFDVLTHGFVYAANGAAARAATG